MPLALGVDLIAEGVLRFVPLPDPTNTAYAEDGYEVVLDAGTPTVGAENVLGFRVRR